jgi:hypothetical protein
MSHEHNDNVEQKPGCDCPQAPRARSVESVDDGNHPLNKEDRKRRGEMSSEPMQH